MPPLRPFLAVLAGLVVLAACGGAAESPEPPRAVPAVRVAVPEPDPGTRAVFERLVDYARAQRLAERPLGEVVQALGDQLVGMPYVAGTLDEPDREELVVRLTGFDCVTFVESVLALAQAVVAGEPTYEAFAAHLEALRYRDGVRDGYCSRLHYFTDWLLNNDRRGRVALAPEGFPGEVPFTRRVGFMSRHRAAYRHLATDDAALACIRGVEADLNAALDAAPLVYVPQARIREAYPQLRAGDVVALVTDVEGLDVAHTGFVYRFPDGRVGLLHASTAGTVVREPDLQRYVERNRRQTGILVARPLAAPMSVNSR